MTTFFYINSDLYNPPITDLVIAVIIRYRGSVGGADKIIGITTMMKEVKNRCGERTTIWFPLPIPKPIVGAIVKRGGIYGANQ